MNGEFDKEEHVYWHRLVARLEPSIEEMAAAEAKLSSLPPEALPTHIGSDFVARTVCRAMGASPDSSTQLEQSRSRRRRSAAATILLVLVLLPSLSWVSRQWLWPRHDGARHLNYASSIALMASAAVEAADQAGALHCVASELGIAMESMRKYADGVPSMRSRLASAFLDNWSSHLSGVHPPDAQEPVEELWRLRDRVLRQFDTEAWADCDALELQAQATLGIHAIMAMRPVDDVIASQQSACVQRIRRHCSR